MQKLTGGLRKSGALLADIGGPHQFVLQACGGAVASTLLGATTGLVANPAFITALKVALVPIAARKSKLERVTCKLWAQGLPTSDLPDLELRPAKAPLSLKNGMKMGSYIISQKSVLSYSDTHNWASSMAVSRCARRI